MGQTSTFSRLAMISAMALLTALPLGGCRKMGFDESPRTMPGEAPENLGPKRMPVNQQSATPMPSSKEEAKGEDEPQPINTIAAQRAAAAGVISPGPSDIAGLPLTRQPMPQPQPQPQIDFSSYGSGYDGYTGDNFWSSDQGWSSTPPAITGRAAAPTLQQRPPAMAMAVPPQPQMQMQQQQQPQLPPLQLLRRPAQMPPQAMPYAATMPAAMPAAAPLQAPASYTPPAPLATQMQPADFPSLYEVPNQPYYRNPGDIAADFADLEAESRSITRYQPPMQQPQQQGYYNPEYPNYPANYQDFGGYAPQPQPGRMPAEIANAPLTLTNPGYAPAPSAGWPDPNALAEYAPASGNGYASSNPYPSYTSNPYAPAQPPAMGSYENSAFVSPAPVAGVPDAPVMTQDWDTSAYQGNNGGGSAYALGSPVELHMPSSGSEQAFLPNSRYTGVRRNPFSYR